MDKGTAISACGGKATARLKPMSALDSLPEFAWGGLVSKRSRWGLSFRGWIALAAMITLAGFFLLIAVYPFLALTARVSPGFLVVEGWVSDYAIEFAAEEYTQGAYQEVFATGGPVYGIAAYRNDFSTAAGIGADRLKKLGISKVHMVPAPLSERDRTYASAVALRDWLRQRNLTPRSINVVTEDVHARRTRLLFQEALGDAVVVGVLAVPNPDYNPRRWWRYSEGVRDVLGEIIAYLYAKFLFFPPSSEGAGLSQNHRPT